jgi:hypothetical protein
MTPKEKAEELFDNFFNLYPNQDAYFIAKQCALIAVDEIIKILPHPDYWQEVKQEIEKL